MLLLPVLLLTLAQADTTAKISVSVATTKATGEGWDIGGGAPDIGICILTASNTACNPKSKGVCDDRFGCSYSVTVPSGPFTVAVYDIDEFESDTIGGAVCKGKGDKWRSRECDVSGRLTSVSLSR